jgi:hypothetical protein
MAWAAYAPACQRMKFQDLEVAQELRDAIATYDQQHPGRGERFEAEMLAVLRRIQDSPLSFPRTAGLRWPVIRRAKVARFPYSGHYYLVRREPVIVAVAHGRRRTGYWSNRLR